MKFYTVLKTGGDYDLDYVKKLYESVKKYTDLEFVCLSDNPSAIGYRPLMYDFKGWWSKLELFRDDIDDDILYMDLDTIIDSDIQHIIRLLTHIDRPVMLSDFCKLGRLASGVMYLPKQHRHDVWYKFINDPHKWIDGLSAGDQEFIEYVYKDSAIRFQDLFPNEIVSLKVHCKHKKPTDAKIVCYHGKPRPRELNWATHISENKTIHPVSHREDKLIIAGSAPSISDYTNAQEYGWKTISVNDTINYGGLTSNYWFTLDPSLANRKIMIDKKSKVYYYCAIPDGFGTPHAKQDSYKLRPPSGIHYLRRLYDKNNFLSSKYGLSDNPCEIHTGNSAYGALGLAYLMQAKQIILIGIDGTKDKKFNNKRCNTTLSHLPELFASAKNQLDKKGIEVINCGKTSLIDCFKRMNFDKAIRG